MQPIAQHAACRAPPAPCSRWRPAPARCSPSRSRSPTSAAAAALVALATFFADPETQLPGIVYWLMGSFATVSWPKLATTAACTAAAGALLLAMRWRINLLSLGDEDAAALGVNVARDRLVVLAAVCLIVAAQVSVSGVIGWVGLVIPHVARLLVGPDHRRVLPVAAALGAAYLMAADTMARSLTPAELPIGILTALVGAPVFAVLLARAARGGALPRESRCSSRARSAMATGVRAGCSGAST